VVPTSMPRKSLMTASGESISSANYICRIGLYVKWEFLEIEPETWPRALLAFIAIPLAVLLLIPVRLWVGRTSRFP
jgi:hypothetical protein